MTKASKEDIDMARARLQRYLPVRTQAMRDAHQWTIVYQLVRHVSKSGMSRDISTYVIDSSYIDAPPQLVCLDWAIGTLVGGLRREGVRISGCGMDMGFALLDHAVHAAYAHLEYSVRPNANDYRRDWL